jgi:hypothetical protein
MPVFDAVLSLPEIVQFSTLTPSENLIRLFVPEISRSFISVSILTVEFIELMLKLVRLVLLIVVELAIPESVFVSTCSVGLVGSGSLLEPLLLPPHPVSKVAVIRLAKNIPFFISDSYVNKR